MDNAILQVLISNLDHVQKVDIDRVVSAHDCQAGREHVITHDIALGIWV